MILIPLAAAIFVSLVQTLVVISAYKTFTKLANCTDHNNCTPPFDICDSLTGACQLTSRLDSNSGYKNFWGNKYDVHPNYDQYTAVVCNEDGNYPSHDCQYFHQCINGTSVFKSCNSPNLPFFDPVSERCTSSATCPTFKCFERFDVRTGLKGQLTAFFAYCYPITKMVSRDPQIFNSGLKNLFIPYVVTRCYGKDVLNENTGRCEPRCLQEGLLPDTSDCHHYFLCSLKDPVNSVFSMSRFSCPQGQAFQSSEYRCVPEPRVDACTKRRAWPL